MPCPCPFQLPRRTKETAVLLAPGQPGASQWPTRPAWHFRWQRLPSVLLLWSAWTLWQRVLSHSSWAVLPRRALGVHLVQP